MIIQIYVPPSLTIPNLVQLVLLISVQYFFSSSNSFKPANESPPCGFLAKEVVRYSIDCDVTQNLKIMHMAVLGQNHVKVKANLGLSLVSQSQLGDGGL